MTLSETIAKAKDIFERTGEDVLVVYRSDHPVIKGDFFYAIKASDKRRWTPGEMEITRFPAPDPTTPDGARYYMGLS